MYGLSEDLRRRAVAHYAAERAAGRGSYEATAEVFHVGRATLDRWLRLERETGDVAPLPRKVVRRSPIDLEWLAAHVAAHPDATLKERAAAHQRECGGKLLVISAFHAALKRLAITHKKRRPLRVSERLSA